MAASLIVNADDFGLEEQINTAVIQAHEEGIVTSASLLATGDAFEHAVELARNHPDLGIGVHLALTRGPSLAGHPLLGRAVASLTDREGLFPQNPVHFAVRAASGAVDPAQVENELRAQLEKIAEAGLSITHIDSHQHIHLVPSIFRIALDLCKAYRVSWIRMPIPLPRSFGMTRGPAGARIKQNLLGKLARWNLRAIPAHSTVRRAKYHAGIEHAGRLQEEVLIELIRSLPEAVVEISSHPGSDDARLSRKHPWDFHWRQELAALCSKRVLAAVEKAGVRLVNYRDLSDTAGGIATGEQSGGHDEANPR